MITITEELDPVLVKGDLGLAEMYCRLAFQMCNRLYDDADECEVAATVALIQRARFVLLKLMDEEKSRKRKTKQAGPSETPAA